MIDIKEITKYKAPVPAWRAMMLELEAQKDFPPGLEKTIVGFILERQNADFTKSYLAWLSVHFHLTGVIPALTQSLDENWLPFGRNRELYCYSPDQALLHFGKESLPALEAELARTDELGTIRLIAIMLFNLHKSKAASREILQRIKPERSPEVQAHFETVLNEMNTWKG